MPQEVTGDSTLLFVTFCDGQVSGEAKYLVSDSIIEELLEEA